MDPQVPQGLGLLHTTSLLHSSFFKHLNKYSILYIIYIDTIVATAVGWVEVAKVAKST